MKYYILKIYDETTFSPEFDRDNEYVKVEMKIKSGSEEYIRRTIYNKNNWKTIKRRGYYNE